MAEISNLGYMVLGVGNLSEWKRFAVDVIGMTLGEENTSSTLTLRADEYAQRIMLEHGALDDIIAAGWEFNTEHDLLSYVEQLRAKGVDVSEGGVEVARRRKVKRLFNCTDPVGYQHEFYYGPEIVKGHNVPRSSIVKGGFKTGRLGVGHIVTASRDHAQATHFYLDQMGLKLTDIIENEIKGMNLEVLFFHTVTGRHHSLATAAVDFGGKMLNHIMLEVNDMNDVGLTYERCLRAQYPVVMHLGHHPNDDMFSFYVQTPSGFDLEFGYGGLVIDDSTWSVRRYKEFSDWGHSRTSPGASA